jgi:hypothetical protein
MQAHHFKDDILPFLLVRNLNMNKIFGDSFHKSH